MKYIVVCFVCILSSTMGALAHNDIEQDLISQLHKSPYVISGKSAGTSSPVYVFFSPECGWCKRFHDTAIFNQPPIEFRWIAIGGKKENRGYLAEVRTEEALQKIIQSDYRAESSYANKVPLYEPVMSALWKYLHKVQNKKSFDYPFLVYIDSSGALKTTSGRNLDLEVLAKGLGILPEGQTPDWGPHITLTKEFDKEKAIAWANIKTPIYVNPSVKSRIVDTMRKNKGFYLAQALTVDNSSKWLAIYYFSDGSFGYVPAQSCRIEKK